MQNVLEKAPGEARLRLDLKPILFILGGLIALVYVVRFIRAWQANRKPWLKLQSRSPDPEKCDAGKSAEKQTKAVRPFGSESTKRVVPVYHS
jgi:hypothetical protein